MSNLKALDSGRMDESLIESVGANEEFGSGLINQKSKANPKRIAS